ncbi:polyamine ABC transporter substrate-binding protein [Paraburkholderia sp.]|uniref:polyamine ABC transporter substrate-binding protein n=1 Tax=Paraburkholderia sp. TaxID=1926495 RepID=UPI0039E4250A
MSSSSDSNISLKRRAFVGAAGAAIAAPFILIPGRVRASQKPLVLVSWGGLAAQTIKREWSDPFTQETGIPVIIAEGPDLAKVKAQIQTGNIDWDIVDMPGSMAMAGARNGFWETVDTHIVDQSKALLPSTSHDMVRMYLYPGGAAWGSKHAAAGKHPVNFPQLFDTAAFPGARALRARVSETLEMALVGSGVSPKGLYPLDVERGFRALDQIKPYVRKWAAETAQMTSLLQTGEVDFSYAYNSRIRAAQASGIALDMSLAQCTLASIYYCVVKGSKNKEAAMKFINFALRPDRQAAFGNAMSGIPNTRTAREMMQPSALKWIPNLADPNHIVVDDVYWATHYDALNARFMEWMLS